jgi:hypothetical protein
MIFTATGMMISRKGDYCCLTRARKGCPKVIPEHDLDLGSRAEEAKNTLIESATKAGADCVSG